MPKQISDIWILGLTASHNGSACLLRNDQIVVAIQEERLTRKKRDWLNPARSSLAINYCLQEGDILAKDLDAVVIASISHGAFDPYLDIHLNETLRVGANNIPVLHIPHHLSHAYSAFALSGMNEAAILVVDGVGSCFESL